MGAARLRTSGTATVGALLLTAGALLALDTSTSASTRAEPDPGGDVAATLYGRDCASCHGPDGRGSWRGPPLTGSGAAGAYYMLSTGRMPIDEPDSPIRRGDPAYSPPEVDALVALVASFGDGPALRSVDATAGDVSRGGVLYRRLCAGCHSATGVGGSLAYDAVAPAVTPASPRQVAAAIDHGPRAMPVLGELLTDDELADVAAYVRQLDEPLDRGGAPLARLGRVDEGLVGWALGVGGLMVAAAWIARSVR